MTAVGDQVRLAVPPEPVRLRARARALAEQAPEQALARLAEGAWMAGPLWRRWGPELRQAGLRRADFERIVGGYHRELWLWVMGERTWAQCAGGLAGRVRRRLPDGSSGPQAT